jgi:hypothetical protein
MFVVIPVGVRFAAVVGMRVRVPVVRGMRNCNLGQKVLVAIGDIAPAGVAHR